MIGAGTGCMYKGGARAVEVQRVGKTEVHRVQAKEEAAAASVSFTEVMGKKRESMIHEKMMRLIGDIEEQGKILAESRTVEDLRRYKKLVKEFLAEAVNNGLKLEQQRGFNRRGRTKVYKIVKEVDSKLIELTDLVLDQEKKGLDILALVGEIKGLLLNIYT